MAAAADNFTGDDTTSGDFALHKRQSIAGELFFAVKHPPPYFGGRLQTGQCHSKRLDDQPAVVAHLAQRVERRLPIDQPGAGGAPIVFRNMHQPELRGGRADRLGHVLFLDMGVERVVHHPEAGMVHLADESGRVSGRVQQIAFEAVEIFDRERDVCRFSQFGHLPHAFDAPSPIVGRRRPCH